MFIGFLVLEIIKLIKKKEMFYRKTYINAIDFVFVLILMILSFGSLIRIGYEETPTQIYWGSLRIEDSMELIDIYSENFEYDNAYSFNLPNLSDDDLTRFDKSILAKHNAYETITYVEHFDGRTAQNIFISFVIIVSLILLVSVLMLLYRTLIGINSYDHKSIYILKIMILTSFIVLLILSIILSTKFNEFFDDINSNFKARISIGLIFGIIISAISLVFSSKKIGLFYTLQK